jgi:nucleoside phosphorylase/NTP pyrophosphatase (non-canonical NTP hydrolase)
MTERQEITLDQLYYMTAYIYSDKNSERSPIATLAHFVEVCAGLTGQARRKRREDFTLESALCKALGWYFPLMAKFNVASIEDLVYRKYPYVCPYCRLEQHAELRCKSVRGVSGTVDHQALREIYERNQSKRPKTLDQWQSMFNAIYPRGTDDQPGRSILGLFEELGELAEAVRVFDRHPKYLAGEAADVFSYLMGIANEHALSLATHESREFSFETAFTRRYPGLCVHCGHQKCVCPLVPDATVGRSAKELDLAPLDSLLSLRPSAVDELGKTAAAVVFEAVGGYSAVAQQLPFDRGETNRALVTLCLRVANLAEKHDPQSASRLHSLALGLTERVALAGSASPTERVASGGSTKGDEATAMVVNVLESLQSVRPFLVEAVTAEASSLAGRVGRLLEKEHCTIGIVTALPIELAAMRTMMDTAHDYPVKEDPNEYLIGTVRSKDGRHDHVVALTLLKDKGNNTAAAAATNLLRSFPRVTDVVMVGVAGAAPCPDDVAKHVRIGDIVVAEEVIQFDNVRLLQGGDRELRVPPLRTSGRLLGRAKRLEADRLVGHRPWDSHIDRGRALEGFVVPTPETDVLFASSEPTRRVTHPEDQSRRFGFPRVFLGRIGAANALVKDPAVRDQVRDSLDLRAFEMEGSGIADATWGFGQSFMVIRGTCDYCDSHKTKEWQPYAATVAAAYTRALIESLATTSRQEAH